MTSMRVDNTRIGVEEVDDYIEKSFRDVFNHYSKAQLTYYCSRGDSVPVEELKKIHDTINDELDEALLALSDLAQAVKANLAMEYEVHKVTELPVKDDNVIVFGKPE